MSGSVPLKCVSRRRCATRDGPCKRAETGAPPSAGAPLTISHKPGQARPVDPSGLVEAAGDQRGERVERGFRLAPACPDLELGACRCGEHHQPHDRGAADHHVVARDLDLGHELLSHVDEFDRRPGVQAAPVDHGHAAAQRLALPVTVSIGLGLSHYLAASPCSTLSRVLATLIYLRPASWALTTASTRPSVSRTLASLISIGRLTPAMISTRPLSMIEIARLDGVPPNMSVRRITPDPSPTASTAAMMSRRRCSMSSSGPMEIARMLGCRPTTCSVAATNSSANRPCVTRTRPIISPPSRMARPPTARPSRSRRRARWRRGYRDGAG